MTDPTCAAQYMRLGVLEQYDRTVECSLPFGHGGNHEEGATGMTWTNELALAPLKARIAELTAANDAALAEFAKQGIQVDAASIQGVRLGELLEHLLGDMDDPRRLAYELAVQERFVTVIADIRGQIEAHRSRSILLNGVNGANLPPRL